MKFLLLLMVPTLYGAIPVVSNVSVDNLTHGTVRVEWDSDVACDNVRLVYGATSGYGSEVYPYVASGGVRHGMVLGGQVAGSTIHLAPQCHNTDGWSSTSGLDQSITFLAAPTPNPQEPTPPTTFNVDYPNTTGYTTVTVASNCSDLQSSINTAVAARGTNGTVISIPVTNTCSPTTYITLPIDPVAKTVLASNVDTGADTITCATCGVSNNDRIRVGGDGLLGQTQAAPLVPGVDYCVINKVGDVFQLSVYPCTGTAINLTTSGVSQWYLAQYPLTITNWVVIRSAATDAQLPPNRVQMTDLWANSLAKIENNNVGLGVLHSTFITSAFSSYLYFGPGLDMTVAATSQSATTDPTPYQSLFQFWNPASDHIIVARNRLNGVGYPERIYNPVQFEGSNLAVVDNYAPNWNFWVQYKTGLGLTLTSSTRVDGAAGTGNGGYFTCPSVGAWNVQTPTSTTGTAYISLNSSCAVIVTLPAGASATCSGCTTSTGTNYPQTGGNWANVLIGTITLGSNVFSAVDSNPSQSVYNYAGATGIISSVGPGPYIVENNNFLECPSICIHMDESGTTEVQPANVSIVGNKFTNTTALMYWMPGTNGKYYFIRQALEYKLCAMCSIVGNRISGNYGGGPTQGYAIEVLSTAGSNSSPSPTGSRDIRIAGNTISNGASCIFVNGNQPGSSGHIGKTLERLLLEHNICYANSGYIYVPSGGTQAGTGLFTSNQGLDFIFRRNTFMPNAGNLPTFWYMLGGSREGMSSIDNFFGFNDDNGTLGSNYEGGSGTGVPNCAGAGTLARFQCAYPSVLTWGGNALLAGYSNSNTNTGAITMANVVSQYSGLVSSALIPQDATYTLRLAASKFVDPTSTFNFRWKYDSPFISGGGLSYGGKGIGADVDYVEDLQRLITNVRPLSVASTSLSVAFHAPVSGGGCYVGYGTSPSDVTGWSKTTVDTTASNERSVGITGLTTKSLYYYQVWCEGSEPSSIQGVRTI